MNRFTFELPDNGSIAVEYWLDDNLCFGSHDTISIRYTEESNGRNLVEQIFYVLQVEPKVNSE